MSIAVLALLIANALWFGAGFVQFTLRSRKAASGLMALTARDPAAHAIVAGSIRFLGGLNLGFAALATMVLLEHERFADPTVTAVLLATFGIAHASQFGVNLPIARAEWSGRRPLWPVLKGTMRLIFAVDALLAMLNLLLFVERLSAA